MFKPAKNTAAAFRLALAMLFCLLSDFGRVVGSAFARSRRRNRACATARSDVCGD